MRLSPLDMGRRVDKLRAMILPSIALIAGLALLVWSADLFVEGSACTARHFGMPPLLIGMVVVGFGTSAPEMVVSAISAIEGNPGIALGNAYGSNITNIALILGVTACISPIAVGSRVLRKELPLLLGVTAIAAWQLSDNTVSRLDAIILLLLFVVIMGWTIFQGLRQRSDAFGNEMEQELTVNAKPLGRALLMLFAGLILLITSSRVLVWGAVEVAHGFGVSDLLIGLTVVAIGTSLPELASSVIAARKGEHDIALGNVIGSNMFNTLAVVGIAGAIHPMEASPEVFIRDIPVMAALTLSIFAIGFGIRGQGRINRMEGIALIFCYLAYTGYLITKVI